MQRWVITILLPYDQCGKFDGYASKLFSVSVRFCNIYWSTELAFLYYRVTHLSMTVPLGLLCPVWQLHVATEHLKWGECHEGTEPFISISI